MIHCLFRLDNNIQLFYDKTFIMFVCEQIYHHFTAHAFFATGKLLRNTFK